MRREGNYALRRDADGHRGLTIWLDYKSFAEDEDDGVQRKRSMMVRDDVWHAEDFSTHVDDLDEEMRCMRADAAREFGFA